MPQPSNSNPLKDYVDETTSPEMTVDGITINKNFAYTGTVDALNPQINTLQAPQSNQISTPGSTTLNNKRTKKNQQNFWSSPADILGSKAITAIQFKLKIPENGNLTFFNHISFDINDVPCNWSVFYKSPISGIMNQLTDLNGNYVGGTLLGTSGYNNGNFGWTHISIDTQVIGTTLLELRLDRNVSINFRPQEINPFATPSGYPFWLRFANIKLNATTWDEVPSTAVITSRNALGLTENYVITQKDGSLIQQPTDRTAAITNKSQYWKSSPQPVGDAVVNLFVDLSSQQTIDSMYMNPLYSGVQCNLYYTNDTTVASTFYCSRAQTNLTQNSSSNLVTFNCVGQQTYGLLTPLQSGAVFPSSGNNGLNTPTTIGIDGTQSWSIGLKYSPNASMGTGHYYTLLEQKSGTVRAQIKFQYFSSTTIKVQAVINGKSITSSAIPYIQQDSNGWPWYGIVINYDATDPANPIASITVDNHTNSVSTTTYSGALSNFARPVVDASFTIGNSNTGGSASNPAYGVIKDLWIRQDVASSQVMTAYFNNPRLFINANGPETSLRGDYRALLLAPLYSSVIRSNPNSDYYSMKTWIPLQSDISVRKSTFRIPTFTARYVKLEFTNLAPEVYPLPGGPITRTVNLFPNWVIDHFNAIEQQMLDTPSNQYQALQTNVAAGTIPPNNFDSPYTIMGAANTQFKAPVTLTELNNTQLGVAATPDKNAITSIVDPTSSSSLLSSLVGQNQSSVPTTLPPSLPMRFPQTSTHEYNTVQITQSWNQSYFAGLVALNFYKVNQAVTDDTEYYFDNTSIAPGNNGSLFVAAGDTFSFNNTSTATPLGYNSTSDGNLLYTQPFNSYTQVNGVQLATIESDWVSSMPIDQVMMTNNNLAYLNTTGYNIQTPSQVSTFNLATGVWDFVPSSSGVVYGVATQPVVFSPTISSTLNMRCSAVARIFLPDTNNGTYQLNLYGYLGSSSTPTLLNSVVTKVPLQNWYTIQVPYSSAQNNIKKMYVEITQIDTTVTEQFYLTLFAPFYNPISWSYNFTGVSTDPWYPITTAINNPSAFSSFSSPVSTFYLRAQSYVANANIKALLVRPLYSQNPYTPQSSIDYFPDPRTNEVCSKVAPVDHPMFKLNSNYYPANLSLNNTIVSS